MNETSPDNVNYSGQSAYDVADLLKQYFRDLPEPIFTSKLTDTFLQIYQCKGWAGGSSGSLGRRGPSVLWMEVVGAGGGGCRDAPLTLPRARSRVQGAAAAGGAGRHHPHAG